MRVWVESLAAMGNLMLLLLAAGTLAWFLFYFFLRRLIRARRIANARERRMLREAAEREGAGDRE
jgi:biopolymer transport protein ExbB/TolQ